MRGLQKSFFSTSRLSAAERLLAWRESIAALFDVSPVHQAGDDFNASLTSYLLNSQVMLSRCESKAQHFERGPLRVAGDKLDHYLVQIQLSGTQLLRRGSKVVECKSGNLMVIDLADRHTATTSDFSNLSLVVPRHLLAGRLLKPDAQQGRVLTQQQPLCALAISHLRMLEQLIPSLTSKEAGHVIEPTLALLASALNGSTDYVEGGDNGVSTSLLTSAKLEIERQLQHNLSVEQLCAKLTFSKATLYRLFEPYGGVRAYMQDRRLRRCAEELLSPLHTGRHIYEIAFSWGFASETHFSRAFKHKFGVTPREARALCKNMNKIGSGIQLEQVGDRDYEQWLSERLKS